MAPPSNKKRPYGVKSQRPFKKQRRQKEYHSDSDEQKDFKAINLLNSDDEDIHNATVEDDADSQQHQNSSSDEEAEKKAPAPKKSAKMSMRTKQEPKSKKDEQPRNEEGEEGSESDEDMDDDDDDNNEDEDEDENESGVRPRKRASKSKRNDPNAFATSLSKILSTKLSTAKRSDPVLVHSAAAHEASRAAMDSALEAKARKQMHEQKRRALEKGRVKDVLVATVTNEATGELEGSTAEMVETERRLRKVAQRGVVKLFNAVRAAQVAAVTAEKGVRKEGVIGMGRRQEKVNEMTKKGFLDLIASGGGALSKNALEEA
jgi:hypothetical protein